MSLCLRLIEDRLEFTRQVGFASHLQRHGFEGYTFERVQRACLGILSAPSHAPTPARTTLQSKAKKNKVCLK